jgi:hypothetical protein
MAHPADVALAASAKQYSFVDVSFKQPTLYMALKF